MNARNFFYATFIAGIFLIQARVFSQKLMQLDLSKGCSFNGQLLTQKVYSFDASGDAVRTISKIVAEVGLKQNFVIIAASVDNACALTKEGARYILYSESFMQQINLQSHTNWAAVSILAHEIGHHLDGHTLDTLDKGNLRIEYELEADEFSGFILARFGASLSESQSAIQTAITNDNSTGFYPPKSARLEAVAVGWNKGIVKTSAAACENGAGSIKIVNRAPTDILIIVSVQKIDLINNRMSQYERTSVSANSNEIVPALKPGVYNVCLIDQHNNGFGDPVLKSKKIVVEACKEVSVTF